MFEQILTAGNVAYDKSSARSGFQKRCFESVLLDEVD